ncbi:phenylacetate--CoA ligase family protein [Solibaculum mannosilyticum]|uniref:phenylacetate--CoA ligase family protein n=1 Tax=Solibaculum mannosilyticum TaxID=2780922 RepID=UPI0034C0966B
MFWQKDLETMPRPKLEELQLERLRWIVDYCIRNVPFYAKRLGEAGVTAEKIKTLSDIQYIPYTNKTDIRDNYPNGLFAVPMSKIVRIHASSGTTGKPTVVGYTKNDLNNWADQIARLATAVGVTAEDVFQISFGYGLFTGALGLHYGLERIGCAVIPASAGNTQKQLMMLRDMKVTGLVSTPSYALYMSECALEGSEPMSDYHLRIGLFGSEGCTPEMRSQIEKNWGLFATDNYGLSELMGPGVSGECEKRQGLHIAEDHYYPEIIDPVTLQPKAPGEQGELVVTTLTKEGFPMLRYRTKDISRLNYEPCACGRTHCRMDKVTGRTDDMLKIRGVNVFPSQVESVLIGMEHIGPHYQLVVRREGFADTLEVKVELINGELLESYSELEKLQRKIHDQLKSILGIETKISLVEPKTLERFQGKAKRILDLRGENSLK